MTTTTTYDFKFDFAKNGGINKEDIKVNVATGTTSAVPGNPNDVSKLATPTISPFINIMVD